MTVKYNNLPVGNAQNLITFTDIPNIVSVEEPQEGTNTVYQLKFKDNWGSSISTPWYMTINADTIRSVSNYADAINKNFLYTPNTNDNKITAMTVANALRNSPNVFSSWRIEYTGGTDLYLYCREIGNNSFTSFQTNMPNTIYELNMIQQGSGSGTQQKVGVDLYQGNDYLTTLTKNFYNGYCGFDMSPLLTTIAEEGKSVPYTLKVWTVDGSGNYTALSTIGTNYISQGYMTNLGNKYLSLGNNIVIAQNIDRGGVKIEDNKSTLYVYGNTILLSVYALTSREETFTIKYKNNAYEDIYTSTLIKNIDVSQSKLVDLTFNLHDSYYRQASYIDIYINSTYQTIRYYVIKPMKATEYYQRICWRNSYGGVSFFDFTGSRTEVKNLEVTTYNKNIFDYYTSQMNELEKVYDAQVNYTVTMKSHIVSKDGSYIFNDLMQSPMIWTYVDGAEQAIIIEDVAVNEIDTNNIFEASVKYRYSMPPSII